MRIECALIIIPFCRYKWNAIPIGSPRIANYPVIGAVGSSVTDDEDAVIDCSILAVVVVKNTRPEIKQNRSITYKHLFLECNNSI